MKKPSNQTGLPSQRSQTSSWGRAFERRTSFQSDAELADWIFTTVRMMQTPSNPAEAEPQGEEFEVSCFMVASSVVGANEQRIAALLELKAERAAQWGRNLRINGLWKDGRVVDADWFNERHGALKFIMDSLVVRGFVTRSTGPFRGAVYTAVPGHHLLETN